MLKAVKDEASLIKSIHESTQAAFDSVQKIKKRIVVEENNLEKQKNETIKPGISKSLEKHSGISVKKTTPPIDIKPEVIQVIGTFKINMSDYIS